MSKVIVIGAGFGGLSIAALLAKEGHDVTVLEKNSQPGGRASMWKTRGFSFDMGPSWYLMPEVFEKFFKEFNKKPKDYYTLKKLDPSYRVFFGDPKFVDIYSERNKIYDLFESFEKGGAAKLKSYLATSEYQYGIAMNKFIYKDYNNILKLLDPQLVSAGLKLNLFQNIEKYVDKHFSSDRAKKILLYTMVFLGGDPKNTPALYSLMSHVDFNLGVWYPIGGLNAVALGMYALCKNLGVHFIFNCEVNKIIVEGNKAVGLKTKEDLFKSEIVVANADYHHVETNLLPSIYQTYPEKYWRKKIIAPSAFLIYLGINKKLSKLKHHNLFLDNDWNEHFASIFNKPHWPTSPSYYICAPGKTDPTVVPKNKENLFILVPVAPGLNDSNEIRNKYFNKIVSHLEKLCGENIRNYILVKRIYAQRDFSDDYNSYKGTALGLSQTLFQTAFFRPSHRSKKVRNLYYTGHYTHPGIGVPMTIISSQIVYDIIKNNRQK